jgi:hypothetical protein
MSTTTARGPGRVDWPVAGLVGAAAGLVRPVGVALLGAAGVAAGPFELALQAELPAWWLVHILYSAAFGVLYGMVTTRDPLADLASTPIPGVATGVAYGVVLWVVNVAVGWTLVTAMLPTLPSGGSLLGPLLGHVVYGGLLGGLYALAGR